MEVGPQRFPWCLTIMEAAKTWGKIKGQKLTLLVLENKKFVDGELVEETAA